MSLPTLVLPVQTPSNPQPRSNAAVLSSVALVGGVLATVGGLSSILFDGYLDQAFLCYHRGFKCVASVIREPTGSY